MNENMYEAMYNIEKTHWWFRAKREIVLNIIGPPVKNQTIIDFGCGTGIMLENLCKIGKATGLDFSQKALDFCRNRVHVQLVQANLNEKLPLDSKFDIGVALDVLEHLDDDLSALKNMQSVLNSGGRLIITVPAFMFLWSAHDENCGHKRRYTIKGLKELVQRSGFEIEYISYYNFWLFPLIALLRCVFRLLKVNEDSEAENRKNSKFANGLLYNIFKSEMFFIKRKVRMPFGVSLIAVVKEMNSLK